MIAAATMYEFSTPWIWSALAETLPCIYGRATFAIVVSSACMITARMMQAVIMPRFWTAVVMGSEVLRDEGGEPARVTGVDVELGAQAGARRRRVGLVR